MGDLSSVKRLSLLVAMLLWFDEVEGNLLVHPQRQAQDCQEKSIAKVEASEDYC
jgi:hypothetical protein